MEERVSEPKIGVVISLSLSLRGYPGLGLHLGQPGPRGCVLVGGSLSFPGLISSGNGCTALPSPRVSGSTV